MTLQTRFQAAAAVLAILFGACAAAAAVLSDVAPHNQLLCCVLWEV